MSATVGDTSHFVRAYFVWRVESNKGIGIEDRLGSSSFGNQQSVLTDRRTPRLIWTMVTEHDVAGKIWTQVLLLPSLI